ncbi:MAG TPA: aldehyde dehydrogenase family protein, partial [Roseiflexaceae bacterium]|nr:aldehyde dehydrogenase family protein [Roseiflexaceae bacterium]
MAKEYFNLIGGEDVASSSGNRVEVRNPADTDDILGTVPASTVEDVRTAIGAAADAFGAWAGKSGPERGKVLYKAANLMEADADSWTTDLTREEGKTRLEASREVIRSVDLLRYFAGEGWRVGGDMLPADTPHTLLYSLRVPVGVCAIITPWNFPLSIPVWKIAPALVTGNSVVFKPASATPILAIRLAKLFEEAGLPRGVINVVTGGGGTIGDALVTDER